MHCIFIKYEFDKYFRTYEFESKADRQRVYSHGLNLQEFGFRTLGFMSSPLFLLQESEQSQKLPGSQLPLL